MFHHRENLVEVAERRARIGCIFDRVVFIFGGDRGRADKWMHSHHHSLGDKTPLEMAQTEDGAEKVEHLIHKFEHIAK